MNRLILVCLSSAALAACVPVHSGVQVDEVISRAVATGQDAVVLSRSGWLRVENADRRPYTLEVSNRTRVLGESGAHLSKLAIMVPPGSELVEFDGSVVQADGTKRTAGKSAASLQNGKLLVELPRAGKGSTIEYHYKIRSHQALELLRFALQSSVPVAEASFTASWPKQAGLKFDLVNLPPGKSADPSVHIGHGSGIPDFIRFNWRLVDLSPTAPGIDPATIVIGEGGNRPHGRDSGRNVSTSHNSSGVSPPRGFGQIGR